MGVGLTKESFRIKCVNIGRLVGVELSFFDDDRGDRSFEDDGAWHVVRHGLRACFNVASDDAKVQNGRVKDVMRRLKLKPTGVDLIDEDVFDDDTCPHCGR